MNKRQKAALAALAAAAAAVTAVFAPAPTPAPVVAPAPVEGTVPAGYTLIKAAGVIANDGLDDTAALNAAFDNLGPYQALQLPAGTLNTSSTLKLFYKGNAIVTGAGKDATIIQAKDPSHSALVVYKGNGVTVQDLQVYSPNSTGRLDDGDARGIYALESANVTVQRVKVRKIAAAGVVFWNVADSRILSSEAEGTLADSFHVTGNSSNILVQFNKAIGAGDDSFSSIGYAGEDLHDISILDNQSYDGAWGSGVSFEGTRNGKALRNKVYRAGAACFRAASHSGYASAVEDGIEFSDNYGENCVTRPELIDAHGAIFVFTDNNYLHNITLARNTIKDAKSHYGLLVKGLSATMNVTGSATGNMFLGVLQSPISVWNYAVVSRSGNTLNGVAIP